MLLQLQLYSVSASEASLPSTRGGATATAVGNYNSNGNNNDGENIKSPSPSSFSIPRNINSNSKNEDATKIAEDSEGGSSIQKTRSTASRIIKKTKNRKIVHPQSSQNIEAKLVEAEAISLASPLIDTALRIASIGETSTEDKAELFIEPMCRPDTGRFALFPIRNHRMWEMYKKHVASFWTVIMPLSAPCIISTDSTE